MSWADAVVYATQLWVMATYLLLALRGRERAFHWANGVGGATLIAATLLTTGWSRLLALTVFFTVVGWVGVWRTWPRYSVSVEWDEGEYISFGGVMVPVIRRNDVPPGTVYLLNTDQLIPPIDGAGPG